jgi:Zn-dependent protease with chaperone function
VSPLIIPIAVEWVILVTTAAPLLLVGRFDKTPRLGLTVWFAAFLSSGLATALAIGIAIASIFETYLKLVANPVGSAGWLATLAVSFAPWLILAISGIALALANQRLEPILANAREVSPLLDAALRPWMTFQGYQVMRIELPIMVAAVARGQIFISTTASRTLRESELHAVLWHEIGHLRGGHNLLKQLAGFVRSLSPWLVASKALVNEVTRLSEIDADRFALRHVDGELLSATRSKFLSA